MVLSEVKEVRGVTKKLRFDYPLAMCKEPSYTMDMFKVNVPKTDILKGKKRLEDIR
jgi:hypothetical protein